MGPELVRKRSCALARKTEAFQLRLTYRTLRGRWCDKIMGNAKTIGSATSGVNAVRECGAAPYGRAPYRILILEMAPIERKY